MLRSKLSHFRFGLVVLSLIAPVAASAQQLPPSVMLDIDTGQDGQIGAVVRTLQPGPNVADLQAFFSRQFLIPWAVSLLARQQPQVTMEPLFDEQEFPHGPVRIRATFPPVCVPAGVPFTPGFVGFIIPLRISSTLTRESFLETLLADYVLEVNGVQFMDSDLYHPQHVTVSPPIDGILFGLPGVRVQFWGLNVTQTITKPGTYVIRNFIRIPKSVPLPEISAIFPTLTELPAGQLIMQQTINIQSSCSSIELLQSPLAGRHWARGGSL